MTDPPGQDAGMKNERGHPARRQLNLGLTVAVPPGVRPPRRPCPPERAAWWFDQMRWVVEQGVDFRAPGVR